MLPMGTTWNYLKVELCGKMGFTISFDKNFMAKQHLTRDKFTRVLYPNHFTLKMFPCPRLEIVQYQEKVHLIGLCYFHDKKGLA